MFRPTSEAHCCHQGGSGPIPELTQVLAGPAFFFFDKRLLRLVDNTNGLQIRLHQFYILLPRHPSKERKPLLPDTPIVSR